MGQKHIDWARPGKDIDVVAKTKPCEGKDFGETKYLKDQWMMFGDRTPLCLDGDNEVRLEGGMSSKYTKAFSISIN